MQISRIRRLSDAQVAQQWRLRMLEAELVFTADCGTYVSHTAVKRGPHTRVSGLQGLFRGLVSAFRDAPPRTPRTLVSQWLHSHSPRLRLVLSHCQQRLDQIPGPLLVRTHGETHSRRLRLGMYHIRDMLLFPRLDLCAQRSILQTGLHPLWDLQSIPDIPSTQCLLRSHRLWAMPSTLLSRSVINCCGTRFPKGTLMKRHGESIPKGTKIFTI